MSVTALAYDPSGKKIYAVGQGNLSVIDVATGVQEQLFALPNARHNEAVFGGGKLYIVNAEDDSFSIYDPEQNSMRPAINISVGPRSVAVTPNGKHLVVCHPDQLKVSIIETEQPSSPPVIFNGQGAYMDVEVSRDGELMYFTNYSRWRVDAIELSNPQNRKTYSLGMDLYRVGVALDSRQLYASTVEGACMSWIL